VKALYAGLLRFLGKNSVICAENERPLWKQRTNRGCTLGLDWEKCGAGFTPAILDDRQIWRA
jgi:hypothetical protein